jgi:hypothetical protein
MTERMLEMILVTSILTEISVFLMMLQLCRAKKSLKKHVFWITAVLVSGMAVPQILILNLAGIIPLTYATNSSSLIFGIAVISFMIGMATPGESDT